MKGECEYADLLQPCASGRPGPRGGAFSPSLLFPCVSPLRVLHPPSQAVPLILSLPSPARRRWTTARRVWRVWLRVVERRECTVRMCRPRRRVCRLAARANVECGAASVLSRTCQRKSLSTATRYDDQDRPRLTTTAASKPDDSKCDGGPV